MIDSINTDHGARYDGSVYRSVPNPWRRYFGRMVDMSIYGIFWTLFVLFVLRTNGQFNKGMNIAGIFVGVILMIAIEPILLSRLGTTPGKWIFGLRVSHPEGGNLTYVEAFERTFSVAKVGMGFGIPLYSLYRHYRSYQLCRDGRLCDWELDYTYTIADTKNWRVGLCVGIFAVIFGLEVLAAGYAQLPINRGDITPEEFYENYNDLMKFYDLDFGHMLNSHGEWIDNPRDNSIVIDVFDMALPSFVLKTRDGYVTEVIFVEESSDDGWLRGSSYKSFLAYMAFVGTRSAINPYSVTNSEVVDYLDKSLVDYSFVWKGIEVSNEVKYEGYDKVNDDLLIAQDNKEQMYKRVFRMQVISSQ